MTSDALGLVGAVVEQVRFDAYVEAGGFGAIYRGHHLGLDEAVAIKCLRIAGFQHDSELREAIAARFRDEIRLLYRLSQGHLDIVRCIGSGTLTSPITGELTPYMVLEWLDGQPLSEELRARRTRGAPPRTLDEAMKLLDSAVGALRYAHAQGVVHRDIKPGNLFLTKTREGTRLKVLDFGLAKILSEEGLGIRPSAATAAGVHFCSPSYGAPEQFSPRVGPIGPWTDVYSLTLVLYELLLGEKVRPANSLADGLLKALEPATGSPTASSLGLRLPPDVERLLARAVAQNPLDRPKDAAVFWDMLRVMTGSAADPALGVTFLDPGLDVEMQAQVSTEPPPTQASGPRPFAGTMLMPNAPVPPHMLQARAPSPPAPFPNPSPLASSFASNAPPPMTFGSAPPPPMHPSTPPPRPPPQLHPLASIRGNPSMFPNSAAASPRPHSPTTPAPLPPLPEPRSRGAFVFVCVVALVLLAIGGVAVVWLLKR